MINLDLKRYVEKKRKEKTTYIKSMGYEKPINKNLILNHSVYFKIKIKHKKVLDYKLDKLYKIICQHHA